MPPKKGLLFIIAALFVVGIPVSILALDLVQTAAESVDPFYEKVLEEGKFFYLNGDLPRAIEDLEIAFFGFLDNPPKLSECYAYLMVCHFQEKHYDKAKYYANEIKRLKLQDFFASLSPPPPEDVLKKYRDIILKLGR